MSAATIEQDSTLLGPFAEAFAAVCGAPVVVEALDPDDLSAGRRMTFL